MTRPKIHPSFWCARACTHVSCLNYPAQNGTDGVPWSIGIRGKAQRHSSLTSSSQTADPEILLNYCLRWFSLQSENWWGICAYRHHTQVSRHTTLRFESCNADRPVWWLLHYAAISDKHRWLFVCFIHVKNIAQSQLLTHFPSVYTQQCVLVAQPPTVFILFIFSKVASLEMGDLQAQVQLKLKYRKNI